MTTSPSTPERRHAPSEKKGEGGGDAAPSTPRGAARQYGLIPGLERPTEHSGHEPRTRRETRVEEMQRAAW
jgi:hypothetical protein